MSILFSLVKIVDAILNTFKVGVFLGKWPRVEAD